MKKSYFMIFIVSLCSFGHAQSFSSDSNCRPPSADEQLLRESDFSWNISIETLRTLFSQVYVSEKRLPLRAYWNEERKSLVLPYLPERGGDVLLGSEFVRNLQNHIEIALQKKYAEAVYFPDMGHSHFLIPQVRWDKIYDKFPVNQFSRMYTEILKDKKTKVLYHTAEMLKTVDENQQVLQDPHIQWRHQTRNVLGSNDGQKKVVLLQNPESKANTVGELKGYFWFSSGYNMSAHEKGCLFYQDKGQTFRFDLSLFDLQ